MFCIKLLLLKTTFPVFQLSSYQSKIQPRLNSILPLQKTQSILSNLLPPKPNLGEIMPYVNIRVAGPLTKEQKAKISKRVTRAISEEAGKPPEAVLIFIDEVDRDNVAKAGKLVSDM